jgi:hypothetical protein
VCKTFPILLKSLTVTLIAALPLAGTARGADEPKPLATAKHPTGLIVEELEVKMEDAQEKVKITWRYRNPTKKAIVVVKPWPGGFAVPRGEIPYHQYWDSVNFRAGKIESDTAYRHPVVKTVDGKYYDASDIRRLGITVAAEGQYEVWAKFVRPPSKAVDKIHFYLPEVELFENLPLKLTKKDD